MLTSGTLLATRMIRATAPKGRLDSLLKFCGFMIVIHAVSISAELLMTGRFHMAHVPRFFVTFFTAAPFVGLTFYAVHRSYRLHKQLVALASTDVLTGLMNRRAFVGAAEDRLTRREPGLVLIVDADHFKRINDNFGHAVGDRCLQAVADRLRAVASAEDIVARIGGEEFGLHLRCDPADLASLEQKICAAIAVEHDAADGTALSLTLSAGATRTIIGDTLEQAMRRADDALYRAKQAGRARLELWCPAGAPVVHTPEQAPGRRVSRSG